MVSVLSLDNRYGGLTYTGKQIGHHFTKSKYYIEPFSGLARTAKYFKSEIMILNDISEYANKKCKKKFPNAIITNMDFIECIKKYNFEDSFFLIDPPWRVNYYTFKNNFKEKYGNYNYKVKKDWHKETSKTNRKTAKQYLKELEEILPTIKGTYIVTLGKGFKIKSPYSKLIIHTHSRLFGHKPNTMMFSNQPLKVQIPQITEFIEC